MMNAPLLHHARRAADALEQIGSELRRGNDLAELAAIERRLANEQPQAHEALAHRGDEILARLWPDPYETETNDRRAR
jgi:hypothetical protein